MITAEQRLTSTLAREGKVEIREDEAQEAKLAEIIELLVAAGYFRARIKGLSPFDKIVGGMTWCIETCNFDVDVDLLFHENLTIGQKIALTEKIVMTLPAMKCPHRLEPHQIQGLDAIHIFPVIQWLVKQALETRAEYGDQTRSISLAEFGRHYITPEEEDIMKNLRKTTATIKGVESVYGPKRRLKRKAGMQVYTQKEKVYMTLLEYGFHSSVRTIGKEGETQETAGEKKDESKLSAQSVGSIVSGRAEEIVAASQHFSQLQSKMEEEMLHDSATSQFGILTSLQKKKAALVRDLSAMQDEEKQLVLQEQELHDQLSQGNEACIKLREHIKQLSAVDSVENQKLLGELSKLVEANEEARRKESQFKEECRKKSEQLKLELSKLQVKAETQDASDEFRERLAVEKERYDKMRRQLAKKTQQVEGLKRRIDDVPGRAELSQYQRRFVELYNQIAATHRETQQFYNMYNTLADSKSYMEKELTLFNSILDNMAVAFGNPSSLDEYLHQMDVIAEGIRQNKLKLERRLMDEKDHHNKLTAELNHLQDLHRQYIKTIHQLTQEISKNEVLHERLSKET